MTPSPLRLSDLYHDHSAFEALSGKGAELGYMLLLNINRKAYTGILMTLSHMPLSDREWSKSISLIFRSIISHKGAELGHMLLLNINGKAYMGSPLL